MTAKEPKNSPTETVEQAMNEVLQAERRAASSVEASKHEAMKIQQAAQQQSRHIARRANERLAICHMRCNARLARELKERERAADADASHSGESTSRRDDAALTPVVEALALALTGITLPGRHPRDR